MSDWVGQYLNEIGLVSLLTAEDERELSQIIERGRKAQARIDAGERKNRQAMLTDIREAARAKDRFIRSNLRLVVSVARRYPLPNGMELSDLIQEGNLGLEHAVDKFDWRKGFKFSTYATFWIRQAIGRALDQKASLVRLPGDRSASLRAALRQVSGNTDELDEDHARLDRLTRPSSLDKSVGEDDGSELVDLVPDANPGPDDLVLTLAESEMLRDLLSLLDDRARLAVRLRFGLDDESDDEFCSTGRRRGRGSQRRKESHRYLERSQNSDRGHKRSYREVGEKLDVTAEAARRLVKRAVALLQEYATERIREAEERAATKKDGASDAMPYSERAHDAA